MGPKKGPLTKKLHTPIQIIIKKHKLIISRKKTTHRKYCDATVSMNWPQKMAKSWPNWPHLAPSDHK